MSRIELLAPAKDLFKAKIAILYGADAVYVGGKEYSLRSRASNFTIDEIAELVQFAHSHGVRVYVTCNIVFHDEDFEGFENYVTKLDDIGVDAIIVSSLAALRIIKKVSPHLPIHLSTQQSIINSDACNMMQIYGADRVILGRECSIKDIELISDKTLVPIEVFIHGGMCANCSGRCTISSRTTNRDANRGGCAHSCRWAYTLYEGSRVKNKNNTIFTMSSKDLNAVQYIEQLMKLGVCSLKIEGRMKSEYYIAQLVKTYKRMIEEIEVKGTLNKNRIIHYLLEIRKAENRPTSTGFFSGVCDETKTIYTENGAGVTHEYVGLVKAYDPETKMATVEVKNVFKKGDMLEVFGPEVDNRLFFAPDMFTEENEMIDVANHPNQILKMPIPYEVQENDMIRIVNHED